MSEHRRTELALRDDFFALSSHGSGGAGEDDKRRFRARVEATHVQPLLEIDGLSLSFHPSARFKTLRFVEADRIDEAHRPLFARPSIGMPHLAAVFVDPEEFSYRSFENILPLDHWFAGAKLDLGLDERKRLGHGREVQAYQFKLRAGAQARAALEGLDALGLHVTPLNPESRGGARFIFHSAQLSDALGSAVRDALPKRWLKNFSHVNPVFRCNRFEPGDSKFRRHVDTPYYDGARKHVSRYTMLIYLTGGSAGGMTGGSAGGSAEGSAQPALQIGDDITLDTIEAMTCVVFRQDQPHEGAAFVAGRKVFLRTELIFEYTRESKVTHEPAIAQTFAKACYFTGESVFAPELARHTHDLYERAAAAHWAGPRKSAEEATPYLHKRFCEFDFATNGYDFWFPKHGPSLQECAALAVLDVLNCKVGGQAFRKLCTTQVLEDARPPSDWLPAFLESKARSHTEPATDQGDRLFAKLELPLLFPPPEQVDTRACCPFHSFATWDAARNEETVELYARAQRFAKRRLAGAAITMMGQEIFLDRDKFVIENGKIHILSEQALAPLNFAACWNDGSSPANYLDVEVIVEAPYLLLPPILFVETEHARHLMLDLFRNSWMVSQSPRSVPVPRIRNFAPDDFANETWDTTPWMDAASGDAQASEAESDEPWWGEDDVVRELYADTLDDD
jgi:hypothetical protein